MKEVLENIAGNREKAGNQHFLFSKNSYIVTVNPFPAIRDHGLILRRV